MRPDRQHYPACAGLLLWLPVWLLLATPVLAAQPFPADLDGRWRRAISNEHIDDFPALLREVAVAGETLKRALVATGSASGKTALMVAAKKGRLDIVRLLVAAGAEVRQRTPMGGSALMFAALGNQPSVADWLYRRGADLDVQGSNGWSALTISAAKGYPDMLDWLIRQGADPNRADVYGVSPLMRAIDNGQRDIALALLQVEHLTISAHDEADNTALHYAVAREYTEIAERLLERGADPDAANRNGQTPRTMVSAGSPLQAVLARYPPGAMH